MNVNILCWREKKMQIRKKTTMEFISVEFSVYHCLLFLNLPLVMSDDVPVWPLAACSRVQVIHSLAVCFRFGWALLFSPAVIPSALGPGVVHLMTIECLFHLPPEEASGVLGRWELWVTPRGHCSIFRDGGGSVSLSSHHMSWSVPDSIQ